MRKTIALCTFKSLALKTPSKLNASNKIKKVVYENCS